MWKQFETSALLMYFKGYPTTDRVFPLFWTETGYDTLPKSVTDQMFMITPMSVVSTCFIVMSVFILLAAGLVFQGRFGWCIIPGTALKENVLLSSQNEEEVGKNNHETVELKEFN